MELDAVFPKLDMSWIEPLDNQVIVQVQFTRVSSFLHITKEEQRAAQRMSSLGKVLAKGSAAYRTKNESNLQWQNYNVEIGDYVLVPKGIGAQYVWTKHSDFVDSEILIIMLPDVCIKHRILQPLEALKILSDLQIGV